jgi:signal transduction histidine kinase
MSSILALASQRVVAGWTAAGEDPAEGAEVTLLANLLANTVQAIRAHQDVAVDEGLRTQRGRRVLELLRAEVIRSWTDDAATQGEIPAVLAAIERVREAIERDWAQHFADRLSGVHGLDLLVAIAHDLRSPLTSILFLAETMQREQSGPVNDVQRRQLGLIYGAALGLSSVASDVIELARGGDQLMEREPTPFSVTAMLESVRDIVRPIAEEKQLAVRLLPPTVDYRVGHPVALSRVLLNLTTNALKFTSQGYVEIVTQEAGPLAIEFAVRDSGKGIEPEIVSSLYQPLRRTMGRTGQSFSQTGLGLAMCQKLVEAMDSQLKVETRRGWGTRFYFELKLPACAQPRTRAPAPSGRRGRAPLPE